MRILLILAMSMLALNASAQPPAGDGTKISILLPGEYYVADSAVDDEVWWVLYATPGEGVRLRYTPISVSHQAGDHPYRVQANGFSEDDVLLLFRGTKELPRGPVATVFNGLLQLSPGLELHFEKAPWETRNTISVQPFKRLLRSNIPINEACFGDYSIDLFQGEKKKQTLYKTFWQSEENWQSEEETSNEFNDALPSLIWAGDLDKDDKLDLLLDLSTHYAGGEIGLFLSSYAKEGELVHLVAKAHTPGGC